MMVSSSVISLILISLSLTALAQLSPGRLEPPAGQRCAGRNYNERRCCTPEQPCDEGEGDCDGPGDGGQHDGHAGCKGDLVCGSNNCLQFGLYYHEKDDCCEKPTNVSRPEGPANPFINSIHPTFFRPIDRRCGGRNVDEGDCCTRDTPCRHGEGDCEQDEDCRDDLVCGNNNCKQFAAYFHEKDDCCVKPTSSSVGVTTIFEWGPWQAWTLNSAGEKRRLRYQVAKTASQETSTAPTILDPNIPFEPKQGQRCAGRNYNGRRCCTPAEPCDEGEGDCDGPADGGQHDGHAGCKGDLVCGSNNCLQFGQYYHPKDDCCERPTNISGAEAPSNPFINSIHPTFFRPIDRRCGGRNVDEGDCCTKETPCRLGEGDCEQDEDCRGDLVTSTLYSPSARDIRLRFRL